MGEIRVGVIGCGDIAFRSYLPAIRNLGEQVRLVATCDVDGERAEIARAECGAAQAFGDATEMLDRTALDGVLILTPMVPHGPLALEALGRGLHVYVEKVMATDLATADRMVELAEQNRLTLACAPSTILLSVFQRVRALLQAGEIGHVSLVQALGAHFGPARWDGYTSDPTWFYRPGAGPLFDLAVYPVQILVHLFGPVRRVTALGGLAVPEVVMTPGPVRGQTLRVEVQDTVPMVLEFGQGTLASVTASYNVLSSRFPGMQFFGSQGALTAPQFLGDELGVWHQEDREWSIEHLPASTYDRLGVAAGLPHWLECIGSGEQPVNNGPHGRHILEVLLAAQESARQGHAVSIRSSL